MGKNSRFTPITIPKILPGLFQPLRLKAKPLSLRGSQEGSILISSFNLLLEFNPFPTEKNTLLL